jgi:hypothetical protein
LLSIGYREDGKMTIALFELEKHMENIKMYAKRVAANIKEGNRKAGQVWEDECCGYIKAINVIYDNSCIGGIADDLNQYYGDCLRELLED